jgi:hypothetical protein
MFQCLAIAHEYIQSSGTTSTNMHAQFLLRSSFLRSGEKRRRSLRTKVHAPRKYARRVLPTDLKEHAEELVLSDLARAVRIHRAPEVLPSSRRGGGGGGRGTVTGGAANAARDPVATARHRDFLTFIAPDDMLTSIFLSAASARGASVRRGAARRATVGRGRVVRGTG